MQNHVSSSQKQVRRGFLAQAGGAGLAAAFGLFAHGAAQPVGASGYGPLRPVKDESTGLPLLKLPEGFRYVSFGWTQSRMDNGLPTPGSHDGMGIVRESPTAITLIRNHERTLAAQRFAPEQDYWDPEGAGGCTAVTFNPQTEKWVSARPVFAGSVRNCAGGTTPWGSWLTCEETVFGPASISDRKPLPLQKDHGWIFEVRPDGKQAPVPLKDMGRFVHEAVAVDPESGIVYETEDRETAGFYRFIPHQPGKLARGGRLQMLKAAGQSDLRKGLKIGQTFDVSWVDIEDPERPHSPDSKTETHPNGDELGVYKQGLAAGGSTFARLEGCWYSHGIIYLDATTGGDAGTGQIWQFEPAEQTLTLIYESPGKEILDCPDNMCVSPRGGIVLCEDGSYLPQRIHCLTPNGQLFLFAANNVQLNEERHSFKGDFRAQEWAGATFDSTGTWFFVNIQTPGITFAITGPWERGQL